ncbi:hypothetical protein F5Y08DRAFT_337890 [Xylaria arbuscula]|nr:hypothetical protein F5Y08DRAFT_337890 [Xylaria arbuscula]
MDFLQISTESFPSRESGLIFVKFVHHLKHVHDRKRVGLRNLAIDMETVAGPNLDGGIYAINPKSIPRHELSDYIETMAQLREVFFVHYVTVNCFDWQRPYLWNSVIDHALPVAPMALHFTRLPHDPRRILQALKDIPVMSHPMLSPFVWSNYSMYGIADNYEWRPRYSVLIASQPRRRIYNARQGREWLEDHSLRWGECLPLFNRYWRNRTETLDPVFGFWLFDLHAFDNILDGEFWPGLDTRPGWMGPARRWPALGVVDLY